MKKVRAISYPALIALGFFILIMLGTALLSLPFASRDGVSVGFVDALFTSTSASCVTGLIIADTYAKWTLFGQITILLLIQIGGLGFMTVVIAISVFLRKKIGLSERSLMAESISSMHLGGIVRVAKRIIKGTLIFEGAGALVLTLRFMKDMSFWQALYNGIFHSISAFCNAGFDLMGRFGENSSLAYYADDISVNITIMALIIIGGIGFFVWDDLCENKLHFRKYALHTKVVLITTAVLIAFPTVVFFFSEANYAFKDLDAGGRVLASFFCSVSPRTAGFSTIDNATLSPLGELLTTVLMFVGGSPGSTAGGVKTTSVAVLALAVIATAKNQRMINIFGRRLEDSAFRRAFSVIAINVTLAFAACGLICAHFPSLETSDVLFETFSAVGTAGLSVGVTAMLGPLLRLVLALLMFCGRVGSLTFALIFTDKNGSAPVVYPIERINIG